MYFVKGTKLDLKVYLLYDLIYMFFGKSYRERKQTSGFQEVEVSGRGYYRDYIGNFRVREFFCMSDVIVWVDTMNIFCVKFINYIIEI